MSMQDTQLRSQVRLKMSDCSCHNTERDSKVPFGRSKKEISTDLR